MEKFMKDWNVNVKQSQTISARLRSGGRIMVSASDQPTLDAFLSELLTIHTAIAFEIITPQSLRLIRFDYS